MPRNGRFELIYNNDESPLQRTDNNDTNKGVSGGDVLVASHQTSTTKLATRTTWRTLSGAGIFVAPLAGLVALWAIVVPLFNVNPRIFPSVGSVAEAAWDSIRDGT